MFFEVFTSFGLALMMIDMSVSMRVDRPSPDRQTLVQLPARLPVTWIPDCRVCRCFGCSIEFTILKRKHHCRSCGRIFCYACSSYRMSPPTYGDLPQPKQRMCASCAKNAREAKETEWLVRVLSIMPVTIRQLFVMRTIDKEWNFAVNTMLSFYRGLQYKLSADGYSTLERNFLWTHFREFEGHVPWQIHAIVSNQGRKDWEIYMKDPKWLPKVSCRQLLCSRTCAPVMSISDIIRLGLTGALKSISLQKWVIQTWKHFKPDVHIKMMFWWVFLGCRFNNLFKLGLIPLVMNNIELIYALWFECEFQKTKNSVKLLKKVQSKIARTRSIKSDISKSVRLTHLLRDLARTPSEYKVRTFFMTHTHAKLPWNPKFSITDIIGFKQVHSASKPVVCNCLTSTGHNLQLLLKNEDVRTDRLAMNIGYWIGSLTTNIIVPIYHVFPLNIGTGCIEMIPNATTIYDIRKKSTLLNYTMNNNPNETAGTLRERMVSSSAGACLLAFTMGLGDRHLQNILVTESGYLVHIDFGYVLGDDPKGASTPMRITEDMVDAMGGKESATFKSFVERTQKGYETMRQHADFWYHLLVAEFYIFRDDKRHKKRIRDHVLDRFVPGEWSSEASLHIQTVVDTASKTSWIQKISDLTHSASNQFDEIFKAQRYL